MKETTITIPVSLIERVSREYAQKFGIHRTREYFLLKLQEEMGELMQAYMLRSGMGRNKGKTQEELEQQLSHELADVLCHTTLLAWHFDIDIEKAINEKWLRYLGEGK